MGVLTWPNAPGTYPMATLILPLLITFSKSACVLAGVVHTDHAMITSVASIEARGCALVSPRREGAWATAPVYDVCQDTSGEKCWHGLVGSSVAPCPY